jgi:hypothetical protein
MNRGGAGGRGRHRPGARVAAAVEHVATPGELARPEPVLPLVEKEPRLLPFEHIHEEPESVLLDLDRTVGAPEDHAVLDGKPLEVAHA